MFSDRSLVPKEAVRLIALGALVERERCYGDLAREIRFLGARVIGPSLDLLGSSLEVLKLEGLAEVAPGGEGKPTDDQPLRITEGGRAAFEALMGASVRPPLNDIGRLVLLMKLRFLPLLSHEAQLDQLDLLEEAYVSQEARYRELIAEAGDGPLAEWLGIDADQSAARLRWLRDRIEALEAAG